MIKLIRLTLLLLLLALSAWFAAINTQPISLFIPLTAYVIDMPFYLLLFVMIAFGIVTGVISAVFYYRARLTEAQMNLRRARQENLALQKEKQSLEVEQQAKKTLLATSRS